MLVGQSVTEWEVRLALSLPGGVERSFWLHRRFDGGVLPAQDPRKLLDDCSNRLEPLNERRMPAREGKVQDAAVRVDCYLAKDAEWANAEWANYIADSEAKVRVLFDGEMAAVAEIQRQWNENGCGLRGGSGGLVGEELTEVLHHVQWACQKIRDFE